jgi:hypothetical protein
MESDATFIGSRVRVLACKEADKIAHSDRERVYLNIGILNGYNNLYCDEN